jgi:hypothetical protein
MASDRDFLNEANHFLAEQLISEDKKLQAMGKKLRTDAIRKPLR